jgi:hypothetical protein
VERGGPEVLQHPSHAATRALVEANPTLPHAVSGAR